MLDGKRSLPLKGPEPRGLINEPKQDKPERLEKTTIWQT